MDDGVREQYEAYPYPPRDPADESDRLITGSPSHLLEIDHYLFAGGRDFDRPFRALVAGGGTGDATVMLAQQLADIGSAGEIVYLDISGSALEVARARIEARNLTNVVFRHGSIAELPRLDLGAFDYIDCCGVLHHLDNPAAGLETLRDALAPDGGMGLMLYAPLGRTGVYHAQAMLGMIGEHAKPAEKVALARQLLAQLPPTNWLKRNPFVSDHATQGDAGLYDLLLHSRDRAYTVMEVADLVAQAELRLVTFVDPVRYDPALYLKDADLIQRIHALPALQRCAFAELLCGNMRVHVFYVVRADDGRTTVASPETQDMVPVLRGFDGRAAAREFAAGKAMSIEIDGLKLSIGLPRIASAVLARIDGQRSLGDIHRELAGSTDPAPNWAEFRERFTEIYTTLNGLGRMFLRHSPRAIS